MTIYETIKAAISVKQAAEHYGLKVSHNGMACCPFHNDRHPSLKLNEDYFFCFGCGAKGDVIDLVARLFNLSSYEAAQKLALDFGLDPKPPTAAAMVKPKRPYIRQFREDEMLCFRVLTDYAVNGIIANADNKRLKEKLASAEKTVSIWKQRYEAVNEKYMELKQKAQPFLDALEIASEKVRAFINSILIRGKQTQEHEHPARKRGQDMEL